MPSGKCRWRCNWWTRPGTYSTKGRADVHEAGMMQTALEAAFDEARRAGAARVRRLVLRVGTESGVAPDALRFAFDALAPGTLADGAALDVEELAAGNCLELTRVEVEVP